jgi:serine/threonine protein kinase
MNRNKAPRLKIGDLLYNYRYRYKIIRLIGNGSFGNTFEVIENNIEKRCLKHIQINLNRDLIEREIEILKYINADDTSNDDGISTHINILRYYHSYFDNEFGYIITEYCDNGDLEQYLNYYRERNGIIKDIQIKDWSKQILTGLKYIHSLRVVHRDIKPANILLTNNYSLIKFSDFGLGIKQLFTDQPLKTTCGSIRYMAPEIALKKESYLSICDVWSVGCVIYELCTLKYTFHDDNENDILNKIKYANFIRLPIENKFKQLIEKYILNLNLYIYI